MIQVALILVALLAAWLFVRIDQRRIENGELPPLPKKLLDRGFTPGATTLWMPHAGIAAACVLSAIHGFFNPEMPPFTGRGHLTREILYAAFGPYGWSGVFMLGGVAFALQAVAKYEEGAAERRKRKSV